MKTNERSPKYVFLHLFAFALLYISVVSFLALLFQYIGITFPDQLQGYTYGSYDAIRSGSAALLVCFPVFIGLSWMLQRDMRATPNLRDMRIRKWLMSLTVFVAAITMVIDLIQVIYRFYGGEITTQFFLKLLAVLAVSAVVFGYYFWEYRRENSPSKIPQIVAWVTSAVVLLTLVGGFLIAGSPSHQRSVRFDEQRVADLQNIQTQIVGFWQVQETLPTDLAELDRTGAGFVVPRDPVSDAAYVYHRLGDTNFQLCATFDTDSTAQASSRYPDYGIIGVSGTNWNHGGGEVCFDRAIDANTITPIVK